MLIYFTHLQFSQLGFLC